MWNRIVRRKSLEKLLAEMHDEKRLHRVLGPISLTALGVGAIIGAGIFAVTGRVAAQDAGPAVMASYVVAGVACVLAALCYSEFAAMVPVAGSAYTYTYATLGELVAWIIGWDLILEYAMACAVVASHWSSYLNALLKSMRLPEIPIQFTMGPWEKKEVEQVVDGVTKLVEIHGVCDVPAILIMAIITVVLVLGIRESAWTNALLVLVKLAVVLFVIGVGMFYVNTDNWHNVPVQERAYSHLQDYFDRHPDLAAELPPGALTATTFGDTLLAEHPDFAAKLTSEQRSTIGKLKGDGHKWGALAVLGVKQWIKPIDDRYRSTFFPYGLSGMMVGAAIVFFAYIGFDSISTHAEEAINPQRDVPIAILSSLGLCTLLYLLVAAVITGMVPYPQIDPDAAIATAFSQAATTHQNSFLNAASGFIALGALAGMTSVLLVTFLSQARIFLAMARDGLLPHNTFGVVHPKFKTPHRSTILVGVIISLTAGFCSTRILEEMVSIGTLMAFVLVCASVLILRVMRPEVARPFRCPAVWIVAPLGMLVSATMMLFLPLDTWLRLLVWLALGMVLYFTFGIHHSTLNKTTEAQATA
jgi:APA family basic amino acid/polyamine antiporter